MFVRLFGCLFISLSIFFCQGPALRTKLSVSATVSTVTLNNTINCRPATFLVVNSDSLIENVPFNSISLCQLNSLQIPDLLVTDDRLHAEQNYKS